MNRAERPADGRWGQSTQHPLGEASGRQRRAVRVRWPDESVLIGVDASDVLDRLREEQWFPVRGGRIGMKRLLARRARLLTGQRINWMLSDERFLRALERAGLVEVEW